MAKKKRKYVRKDKSIANSKLSPILNESYANEVEEYYRESDTSENPKATAKIIKPCRYCEEIDKGLKRCYIMLSIVLFMLAIIYYSYKKASNKGPFIFFGGIFIGLLCWNIGLIISYKQLRKEYANS